MTDWGAEKNPNPLTLWLGNSYKLYGVFCEPPVGLIPFSTGVTYLQKNSHFTDLFPFTYLITHSTLSTSKNHIPNKLLVPKLFPQGLLLENLT